MIREPPLDFLQASEDRLAALRHQAREQQLDQRQRGQHRMEEGYRFGAEAQRVARLARERRDDAVGERDHGDAAGRGGVHGVHRRRGVGRLADRHQRVSALEGVGLVEDRAADSVEQHPVAGDEVVRVAELEGHGKARAHAEESHAAGARDRRHRRFDLRMGVQGEDGLHVLDLGAGDRLRQAAEARSFRGRLQSGRAPAEIERAARHRLLERPAQRRVVLVAEGPGQPHHRGRRHAGAPGLLAHGKQSHFARVVSDPARGALQLGRERVE